MASAIHFINKPDAEGNLERLTRSEDNIYRTCCWAISRDEAERLKNGWIYLHEAKDMPSRFGGKILSIEPVKTPEFAHEDRFAFRFTAHLAAKKALWRGSSHAMAWSSGVINANLPHEIA